MFFCVEPSDFRHRKQIFVKKFFQLFLHKKKLLGKLFSMEALTQAEIALCLSTTDNKYISVRNLKDG